MQLDLFSHIDYQQLTEELFSAYFDCRKNKRNTLNALKFEKHLEQNVFKLIDDIYKGNYQLGRSIAFIVNKPVKREILPLILETGWFITGLSINSIPFLRIFLYRTAMPAVLAKAHIMV